jgi:hypothetical protein
MNKEMEKRTSVCSENGPGISKMTTTPKKKK